MSNIPSRSGRPSSGLIRAARTRFGFPARTAVLAFAVALTVAVVPSVASLTSPALADEYTDPVPATEPVFPDETTGEADATTYLPPSTEPVVPDETAGDTFGTSATGQAIVDFAMQYVGSPYVWAGNTPAGFDCSGFTQFVVQNVTGLDIGHGTEGQLAYGTPVAYDDLQPGDLVYFTGTGGPGISHVAIYIGDGQIVHAENETTGVKISDLWGGYDAYYYSAIRIG